MKRIGFVFLLILSLIAVSCEYPSQLNAQEVPVDIMSMGTFYDEIFVSQLTTGEYRYTNCVPSSVKMLLNLHQIESETVHDIRMKIWYDDTGCLLYDAMKYIELYDVITDWDYVDSVEITRDRLDEWYVMCLVKMNGYYHCIVIVDYTEDGYMVLDPAEDKIVMRDTIGVIDKFVVYVSKDEEDTQ